MNMSLRTSLLAIPAATLLLNTGAHAIIVLGNGEVLNLASLMSMNDRRVQINDKIFNFESFTSSTFDTTQMSIIGFVSLNTNQYGLYNVGFDITGPLGDSTPGDNVIHEANLQYTVEVEQSWYDRGVRLCDAQMVFNGNSYGGGSYAAVDETIFDLDANQYLGELEVFHVQNSEAIIQLVDAVDFCDIYGTTGYRAFEVNKNMKFLANGIDGVASCSFIRQEFSQVPTPGAFALLGVAGILGARRRR